MTLKNMMLGSAIAALVAGGAMAQSAGTSVAATADTETSVEAPMGNAEASVSTGMAAESDTGVTADSSTNANSTSAMTTQTDTTAESNLGMGGNEVATQISAMTVDDIVGTNVIGMDKESIGEVDYVVQQTDGLAFVIGIGGFLGLGEYTVAIPADQFSVNADGDLVLSTMTKAELEALPEFNEDDVESLDGDLLIGDLISS
ncbi:PRC-barrel domain-containing protein [Puniceibacterium sediminis]|uniref:PRC-barrel domain-containing protein n=1 Tax=Puniceibacterium sediminis TaxID=1608407 RepID=A0A238WVI8_9RHOB|nr:PRC-barrel domain-containing protein [Puniceibacterium sediminis]SNR50536.1 PRC-barrel domain-containing protein [Puniceibacterium sediminis]